MKVFLFIFVALVVLVMIAAAIYISLPSEVLGNLENRFRKKKGDVDTDKAPPKKEVLK